MQARGGLSRQGQVGGRVWAEEEAGLEYGMQRGSLLALETAFSSQQLHLTKSNDIGRYFDIASPSFPSSAAAAGSRCVVSWAADFL